ncbi:MAG: Rrf2 family transcriptional regulator [Candidatus Obscuribacterales bacterium]
MIPKGAEYALRVVVLLYRNNGRRLASSEISERTKITIAYIPKVLKPLINAGLVTSSRGTNGGYRLTHPRRRVSVLDILSAFGSIRDDHSERTRVRTDFYSLCQTLDQIDAHVLSICAKTTIAHLSLQ